ncbi:MAG TPA: ATP-binding protein [Chloroflexota bacterium]|nr:ATP-binding protein [Chloroflexota bacterium]
MYPHEIDRREADLGLLDYSARPVAGAALDDLDPLERTRVRQAIQQYGGDRSLLVLSDEELDGALGLTRRVDDAAEPTVAGLLLLGSETALREHLPTHEVAFQDLAGTQVRANEFYRRPLLWVIEEVMRHVGARNREEELLVGPYRVPVPAYDPGAVREALANAITHRDYTQLGAVHVRWLGDAVEVSNPGGFPEGVSVRNLLVTEPRPRNPLLADALKRIGLVERTGRGVDVIFQGSLRYGRPPPDYGRSTATSVVVRLPDGPADLPFLELVIREEERRGSPLPVDDLLALRLLREGRGVGPDDLARTIHRGDEEARQVLERLAEAGLAVRNGKHYRLSATALRRLEQTGVGRGSRAPSPAEREDAVLRHVASRGRITRRETAELVGVGPYQASRLLDRLVAEGKLVRRGERRGTFYERRS